VSPPTQFQENGGVFLGQLVDGSFVLKFVDSVLILCIIKGEVFLGFPGGPNKRASFQSERSTQGRVGRRRPARDYDILPCFDGWFLHAQSGFRLQTT
jgi:hypothetical protein